jgi:hypothetical protein
MPALSLCTSALPLLLAMAIARRSSRACAPPWVGGGALGRAHDMGRRSSRGCHESDAMRTGSTRDARLGRVEAYAHGGGGTGHVRRRRWARRSCTGAVAVALNVGRGTSAQRRSPPSGMDDERGAAGMTAGKRDAAGMAGGKRGATGLWPNWGRRSGEGNAGNQ